MVLYVNNSLLFGALLVFPLALSKYLSDFYMVSLLQNAHLYKYEKNMVFLLEFVRTYQIYLILKKHVQKNAQHLFLYLNIFVYFL